MTSPRRHDDDRRAALQRETRNRREALWKGANAGSLGIEMAVAVIIGVLVGRWLDGRFETDPLWTVIFLCLGIAAGFRGLIRVARQHQSELRSQRSSSDEADVAQADRSIG